MNYILFHIGPIPNHLVYCLNSIKTVDKDAKIILCTDQNISSNEIDIINFFEFDKLVKKKKELESLYKNTLLEDNPLWPTSLLRVFSLQELSRELNLNNFVHFDNDVVLYKSFNELNQNKLFLDNKINITFHDFNHLVFGYSYFSSSSSISKLSKLFDKILNNYEFYVNNYAKGAPLIEMRMLGISEKLEKDLFNSLPILPYDNKEIIFDPSSYGQYLNGSHLKRGNYIFVRRWVSTGHIVGRELKSKRILVNYSNNKPTVKYDNSIFELANLHVHSKKLHKFLPGKYRNIVSI